MLEANPAGSAGEPWRRARRSRRAASGRVGGAGRGPGAMPVAWLRPAARVAARGRILGAFGKCKDGRARGRHEQARPVHWRCVARSASLRAAGDGSGRQHRPACQSGQIQPDAERCVRHQAAQPRDRGLGVLDAAMPAPMPGCRMKKGGHRADADQQRGQEGRVLRPLRSGDAQQGREGDADGVVRDPTDGGFRRDRSALPMFGWINRPRGRWPIQRPTMA